MDIQIKNNVGAVILAAGISKRMKSSKPLLLFNREETFLEKIVREYSKFNCHTIIVVVNKINKGEILKSLGEKLPGNVRFVINDHLEYERFYSVKLGLAKLEDTDFCFIQNIDNPFVTRDLIATIFRYRVSGGYVSPRYKGEGGHPILLGRAIIEDIRSLKENDLNFRHILRSYPCEKVEVGKQDILVNINTLEEYILEIRN